MNTYLENNKWWIYYVLTYTLSWSVWIIGGWLLPEDLNIIALIIGAFGPWVSAIILIRRTDGRTGVREWFRNIFRFRMGTSWYLVSAIVLPFGLAAIHHGIYLLLGGTSGLDFSAEWILYFAYLIPTALLSGGNEEPGWRGYITPVLIKKFNIIPANIIVGAGWALWHVPLYFTGYWGSDDQAVFWLFMYCIPLSMIMTWLYYKSGSVISVMLFHAGSNVVSQYFPMETDLSQTFRDEYSVIKTFLYLLVAIILLIATKGKLGYRTNNL